MARLGLSGGKGTQRDLSIVCQYRPIGRKTTRHKFWASTGLPVCGAGTAGRRPCVICAASRRAVSNARSAILTTSIIILSAPQPISVNLCSGAQLVGGNFPVAQ